MAEEKRQKKYGRKRGFSAFGRICKWTNLNRPNAQMADLIFDFL
jgi:hypothetical protein